MKKTRWFDAKNSPKRSGWYECRNEVCDYPRLNFWNASTQSWYFTSGGDFLLSWFGMFKGSQWRGLTTKDGK